MNESTQSTPHTPEDHAVFFLTSPVFWEPEPVVAADGHVRRSLIRLWTDVSGVPGKGVIGAAVVQDTPDGPHLVCRLGIKTGSIPNAEYLAIQSAINAAPRGHAVIVYNDCQEAVLRVMRELSSASQGRMLSPVELCGVSPSQPLNCQVVWEPRRTTPAGILADDEAAVAAAQHEAMYVERLARLRDEYQLPRVRLSVIETVVPGQGYRVLAIAARFLRLNGSYDRTEIRVRRASSGALRALAGLVEELGVTDQVLAMGSTLEVHQDGATLLGDSPRSELESVLLTQAVARALPMQTLQMLIAGVADFVEVAQIGQTLEQEHDPGLTVGRATALVPSDPSPQALRDRTMTVSCLAADRRPSRLAQLLLDPSVRFTSVRSRSLRPMLDSMGLSTHPGGERSLYVRVQRVGPMGELEDRPMSMRLVAPLGSGVVMPEAGELVDQRRMRALVSELLQAPCPEGEPLRIIREWQAVHVAQGYEDWSVSVPETLPLADPARSYAVVPEPPALEAEPALPPAPVAAVAHGPLTAPFASDLERNSARMGFVTALGFDEFCELAPTVDLSRPLALDWPVPDDAAALDLPEHAPVPRRIDQLSARLR